jgi:hypothetical protein
LPLVLRVFASLILIVLTAGAVRAGDEPMTVTLQRLPDASCFGPCPQWLALSGRITKESPAILRKALAANPKVKVIMVSSGGGDVTSAEAMGDIIRKRRMDIIVGAGRAADCFSDPGNCAGKSAVTAMPGPSYCASACVQLLAAGVNRAVWPRSQVGVHRYLLAARTMIHQVYDVLTRTYPDGRKEVIRTLKDEKRTLVPVNEEQTSRSSYDGARRYFGKMGVDARIVDAIESTAHSNIRVLVPTEMMDWKLLTTEDPFSVLAGGGAMSVSNARITARAYVMDKSNAFVGQLWIDISSRAQAKDAGWQAFYFADAGTVGVTPLTLLVRENVVSQASVFRQSPILVGDNRTSGGPDKAIAASMSDLCRLDSAFLASFALRAETDNLQTAGLHGTFYKNAIQTSGAVKSACTPLR